MEHAAGIQLHQKWPTMSGEQQISCIEAIFTHMRQIPAIEFPAYGSLYFANCHIDSTSKVSLDDGFCVGPHCGTRIPESRKLLLLPYTPPKDDPTIVTAIIDWQSSSIEPALEYADDTPDFAAPSPNPPSENQAVNKNIELCRKAFAIALQGFMPDGAVVFRQELIDISKHWKELGLSGDCPYPIPTSDELVVHEKAFKDFVMARDIKQKLVELLDTTDDGWVPTGMWEATKSFHKQAFETLVQAVREAKIEDDEEMSEEDLRRMWPFDLD
ncbi:MAG: hypothetical protein Q9169_008052 [Polycauliona sp. 2 TL-2023]